MLSTVLLLASCVLATANTPGGDGQERQAEEAAEDEDLSSLLQLGVSTASAGSRMLGASIAREASSQSILPVRTAKVPMPVHLPAVEGVANSTHAAVGSASSSVHPNVNSTRETLASSSARSEQNSTVPPPRNATTQAESDELLTRTMDIPYFSLVNNSYGLDTEVTQEVVRLSPFRDPGGWLMFFIGVLFPTVACMVWQIIGCCLSRSMGKAIEFAIETYDTAVIGVDVEIGKLSVNPFEGVIIADGLTIDNPKGYKSDYLLNAKLVHIDFDMKSLIFSGFSQCKVQKFVLQRVDIIYEKTWSSSNVHDVLQFLEGDHSEDKDKKAAEEAKKRKAEASKKNKKDAMNVELQEVLVEDVGLRLQGQMIGGHGARLALADIKFDNFTKEVGSGYMDDIVKVLLKSIMKTVVANVVGRRTAEWCM